MAGCLTTNPMKTTDMKNPTGNCGNGNGTNKVLAAGALKELAQWLLINKRSVFLDADISKESKKKILNELGYSSNSLDGQPCNIPDVNGSNHCKQCKKEIDKGFRFCSGICKEYYYR